MHPTQPIAAPIESLEWLAGQWAGERENEVFEEWWSKPAGGTIVGMFRLLRDGALHFYELLTVETESGRLVWRIKHFDAGLVGWEERDAAVTLDLVALDGNEAVFLKRGDRRWMVYRFEPTVDELVAYFETESGDHVPFEFRYARR